MRFIWMDIALIPILIVSSMAFGAFGVCATLGALEWPIVALFGGVVALAVALTLMDNREGGTNEKDGGANAKRR